IGLQTASSWAMAKDPWCDGAPDEYVIEDVKAKVVDSETGEPIEGAVVVGQWYTVRPREYLKITEAVTDKNGEFVIPGWGPFKKPRKGCLFADDPLLKIFKSGYFAWVENNQIQFYDNFNLPSDRTRKFLFTGKTIKLKKLVIGNEHDYFDSSGQPAKRPLTEQDYCYQLSDILRDFSTVPVEFSLPNLLAVMKEEVKQHPDCNDWTGSLEQK
ncbi:MAG TPA: carboxypeptidase-like regulatory domain-containing protein, partial [Nitrospiria bacterium]